MHATFASAWIKTPYLVVELLVAWIEGLKLFTDELIQNAPIYQGLPQLSDLCPVVPRMPERTLQRLVENRKMGK